MKSPRPTSRQPKKSATRPVPKRRLWFFRLTALLLPLGLIGLLEISLRLGGYGFNPDFFKRIPIGGEEFYVQNDDFSLSFFPRETVRNPGVLRLRAQKPAGTIRIFILGESAAMGDPEPAFGPARFMEIQLREKFPGAKFEIVNTAFTAINSHVIVPIARECARHAGDYWIVYMGNNEMVGPFGAATVFGRQAPPLPYVRLATAIQRTRTGQLCTALARKFRQAKPPGTAWNGMQMFLNNQVAPDSPMKVNVYRNFEKNLDTILRAGVGSGAKVLMNTVAVNLKDCPPFGSLPALPLDPAAALETNGDFVGAQRIYTQLASQYASSAALQFRWGHDLLMQNNYLAAREHLQLACDNDSLPFRTDSHENNVIRAIATQFSTNELTMFDAANFLAAQNLENMCGNETFYEHVHFDCDGSHRLGLAWAQQLEKMMPANLARNRGWLTQTECATRLGLSTWNRAAVLDQVAGRLTVPPFISQPNNLERQTVLTDRLKEIHAEMNPQNAATTRINFLTQLAGAPEDFELRANFALFLQATHDLPGAVAEWRRIHELVPHDFLPFYELGHLSNLLGQNSEAETPLRTAVKLRPSLTEAWSDLACALAAQSKFTEALDSYAVAQKQRPQDGQTLLGIAKIHARQGDHLKAMEDYRAAVLLNPRNWEAHFELGGELDAAGRQNEALAEFGEAVRLRPDYSRAHFNHGVLLAKQGRLDEARNEFTEALRLEPGYKNAQGALTQLPELKMSAPKN